MKIAIAADEISFDFETAVSLGLEWGIDSFELKRLSRRRIPDVDGAEIELVESILKDTGATLTSLAPGIFKDALTPEVVHREMDRLDRSIELAHRLDVSKVIVFGFERDSSAASDRMIAMATEALGRAAARAHQNGVTLLLENEPAFWIDCPDVAVRVVEAVDCPAMKINWDPCNALGCREGSPYPWGYELARPYIDHVHVKDGRLRADGTTEYALLGTGELDWEGQFRALIRDGYEGYCVLEPHFGNRVASSRAAASEALKLVQEAEAVAGAS